MLNFLKKGKTTGSMGLLEEIMKKELSVNQETGFSKFQIDQMRDEFKLRDPSKLGIVSQSDVISILRGNNLFRF